MRQTVIFFAIILLLTGCRSKQSVTKENVRFDAVENVDTSAKETAGHSSYSDVVKDVKTSVQDKTVTRATETEYSAPDESGKQHKTKEKTTETLNDIAVLNEQNERTISEQKTEIERLTTDNSELKTRLNAALSEKTKTTTRAPFWTYIVTFVGGAVVALITRTWIKTKFRFLKGKAF